ncbi:MAG: glycoside hydrolase family 38 C-terminal domain-containing protein [Opitutaceae bacterium]|jgi:alpha-mannosidase
MGTSLLAPSLTTLEQLILKVSAAIYTPVAPLEITSWRTDEPVSFALRETGEQSTVGLGDTWGKRLFDCAWMRFRATLPSGLEGPFVARIDVNGELCIVDETGVPVRGLTNVKSTFDERLGGPAKTIYRLPPAVIHGRDVEFWADAAFNDLFGFLKDNGTVALAEIATCREDLRQLYYDLETLRDFQLELPTAHSDVATSVSESKSSLIARQLNEAVLAVAANLDCRDPASVERARATLRPWFNSPDKDRLLVHAVGHAHLDLAWLWPLRETIRKGARTFASALYNIERYPEYVFGCSQPQLFAWMKEHYPALYVKIKEAVRAGRIEPQGTFWVEPDCNMPSGEAFVRQILLGAKFFREEFGIVPTCCWEPDVFGYNGQLPQILKRSGHDYFMTQKLSWNVVNRFGHQSFHWEGIDGTSILTHMLPEETYNSPAAARSLRKIATDYFERDVSDHALMAFGIGDGGGGPDAEHLERLRRAPGLPGLPAVKIEPAAAFFKTWSADASKFPTWKGELYLERHQGTLTTQAKVKRNNRKSEIALRETEWAAFLAATHAGLPYPAAALDRLWKEILLYQFHDILPGSSIKRVYDECNTRYEIILAELAALQHAAYAAAASKIAPAGALVAFNSLSWPRNEWIKVDGAWEHVTVPALGWAPVGGRRSPSAVGSEPATQPPGFMTAPGGHRPPLSAHPDLLENETLRVTFAEDGRIRSLYDKKAAREIVAAGEFCNEFVVIPDTGDAWDFETDHGKKDVWGYLRQPTRMPKLHQSDARIDGPCAILEQVWRTEKSEIRQTIRLMSGADSLAFETTVDWQEPATMLRVRFPVAIKSDEARFEIPFGSIRRSTLDDTSHRHAQIEVAAQQWVDLSQADYGVALFNDCKYGFRIKGHTIDMNLIRSVPHPGAPLIGKDDKADGSAASVYGDLGRHVFNYSLQPHAGPGAASSLTAAARMLNTPLAIVTAGAFPKSAAASPVPTGPKFTIDSPSIELAAVKPTDDGHGWALRLVNVDEQPTLTTFSGSPWTECNMMEQILQASDSPIGQNKGSKPLAFHPFEIKSLRIPH